MPVNISRTGKQHIARTVLVNHGQATTQVVQINDNTFELRLVKLCHDKIDNHIPGLRQTIASLPEDRGLGFVQITKTVGSVFCGTADIAQ